MLNLLILLALPTGLAKCWTISQRPTTNRKCVGSLMVLLVAWMASIAVNWAFELFAGLEALGIVLGSGLYYPSRNLHARTNKLVGTICPSCPANSAR